MHGCSQPSGGGPVGAAVHGVTELSCAEHAGCSSRNERCQFGLKLSLTAARRRAAPNSGNTAPPSSTSCRWATTGLAELDVPQPDAPEFLARPGIDGECLVVERVEKDAAVRVHRPAVHQVAAGDSLRARIVLSATIGAASWPLTTPVENLNATCSWATLPLLIWSSPL